MAKNPKCSVYIGNLDEKVSERVLYEILIQVGRVVDLHIPRDKETSRPKGFAFAEYETEEIAQYAVRLFSGLVRLYNKTLKFAISGQDKPSSNGNIPVTPKLNSLPLPKPPQTVHCSDTPVSREPAHSTVNGRIAGYAVPSNYSHSVYSHASFAGAANRGLGNSTYEHGRHVVGSVFNDVRHPAARQPPLPYPSY